MCAWTTLGIHATKGSSQVSCEGGWKEMWSGVLYLIDICMVNTCHGYTEWKPYVRVKVDELKHLGGQKKLGVN